MWDNVLLYIPSGITEITRTLERTYALRRFNRDALGMSEASGSALNRVIGIGKRTDRETGKSEPVTSFYPSHFREVVDSFQHFPIADKFGLSVTDAMAMPLDQWFHLRKVAETLAATQQPDHTRELIEVIKVMNGLKGGEG